ncbi:MAG: glycerol-3-phosphate 1-O-acyltransferase PlsY [Proteobacteria bacterium]|nr:glycerol-3-phosphate 1-O-acyltransferase PlsY [Pseudomonadota bacterium]
MPAPLGDLSYTWPFIAAAVGGYLLGSVPFGLILTRVAGLGDIRDIGSGNIGTMNVLRTGNKWLAALTLLFDAGKGAGAVLIAGGFGPDMAVLAGAGAVVGHLFPLWLRFRGGKGVATALGVLAALAWEVALLAVLTWLAIALIFRYGSLASMVSLASSPFYAVWLADPQRTELAGFMAILVILRHHANIRRLIKREEPKIGRSAAEK